MTCRNSTKYVRKIRIVQKCMMNEGGYVDDTQKIDQPTLNKYNADHPNFNFPETVKDLTPEQVQQIYTDDYYDAHHIGEIKNARTHIKILYRKTPAK